MKSLKQYEMYLIKQELSEATIAVYLRITKEFLTFVGNRHIDKKIVLCYKEHMKDAELAVTTMNQHIIAVNRYLRFCGYSDCVIKTYRIQRQASLSNVITDEDYRKLLAYAKNQRDDKYYAIMKTLVLTGIRVSELSYITVENIGEGHIIVWNKGKVREIFLPDCLIAILEDYCKKNGITEGCIFRGNTGKAISREAVWGKLNRMAGKIGIDRKKAHPHSFRHYFALLYLKKYSNLFELADILGHASLETTRIYAVATVEDKRQRMGQLDSCGVDEIQYSEKIVKGF